MSVQVKLEGWPAGPHPMGKVSPDLPALLGWAAESRAQAGRERGVWQAKGESEIKSLADASLNLKSRQGQGPGSGSRAGGWELALERCPEAPSSRPFVPPTQLSLPLGPLRAAAGFLSRKRRAGRLRAPKCGAGMKQPLAPCSGHPAGARLSSAHRGALMCTHGGQPPVACPVLLRLLPFA